MKEPSILSSTTKRISPLPVPPPPIEPGSELPGGLVALYDGRGRNETPLWLPEPVPVNCDK